jgi:hypothetical protein
MSHCECPNQTRALLNISSHSIDGATLGSTRAVYNAGCGHCLCVKCYSRHTLPLRRGQAVEVGDVPLFGFDDGRVLAVGVDPAVDGPALAAVA